MGRACSMHGETTNVYRIFVGNPEGRRPLGVPRHRWEEYITRISFEVIIACLALIRHGPHRKQKCRGETLTARRSHQPKK
jgi:hypothetical protein